MLPDAVLKSNISFYKKLTEKIKAQRKNHNVLYDFMPDHGCHEIDDGCGSHGLDMEEDMDIIHLKMILDYLSTDCLYVSL